MRNNLGKLGVVVLLLFLNTLYATTYKWSVTVDKTEAYENEAIYLHYSCNFSDTAELYVVEFNPSSDNEEYKLEILREETKIVDGRRINEYEFLLVVKKAGEFNLELESLMKKTNKDSIENSVLGRDNANYEEFSLTKVLQKSLHVKVLKSPAPIVGEFQLKVKKGSKSVEAYEPYHLTLEIEGVGDFSLFKDIDYEIEGVKVFSEPASEQLTLTKDGERGRWIKKFAFVSEKDFVIEPFELEYFDLGLEKLQHLKVQKIDVHVKDATFKKEELLDEKEEAFEVPYEYLYYLLTLLAGFLLGKIEFKKRDISKKDDNILCLKIKESKTVESIAILLALTDIKKYEDIILQIESKELNSLSKVKKILCH